MISFFGTDLIVPRSNVNGSLSSKESGTQLIKLINISHNPKNYLLNIISKMDQNKIHEIYNSQINTDVELIFSNNMHQVTMHVHKNILTDHSDYFRKMFDFNKDITTAKIFVDEPTIAHDIICSFYGIDYNSTNYPEWQHTLKVFKMRQYFCLDNDVSKLYNLNVPSEGFDLFLEVASQFDVATDRKLLKSIKRNLPEKYDLEKLDVSFIELLQKKNYRIISASWDSTVKIWDADDGSLLQTLPYPSCMTGHAAFSHDGLKIALQCKESCISYTIKIFDIENGSLIQTLTDHANIVRCIVFSPDDLRVVSSNDSTIKIWDVISGSLLHTLTGDNKLVWSIAFSPDGLQIVSAGTDYFIKIWNTTNGSLVQTLVGHMGSVWSAAYSPDGLKIVSGSSDNMIKIWDVADGSLIRTLISHTDEVNVVSFSQIV